jgi:IS30 family transposase
MKKKSKLTRQERLEIEILLRKQYSCRAIAKALDRSPNTISYEIEINGGRKGYSAINANIYARTRKKMTRREWSKIEHNNSLRDYIIEGLRCHWNPDEIAGKMKKDNLPFYASKTAIYEWLRSYYGQQYCRYLYTQRYTKKKRKKKTERVMIPQRVSIHERFIGADNRTRYGHWEQDTIVSRKGCSGGLSSGIERKSRLVSATLVKSMSSYEHMEIINKQKEKYKTLSFTFDNGIENKSHRLLGVPTFFCDKYNSGQKGSVENANKMIRRYFPKGTNFRQIKQKEVDRIVEIINKKPRKILGYYSALEVASAGGVLLNSSVS